MRVLHHEILRVDVALDRSETLLKTVLPPQCDVQLASLQRREAAFANLKEQLEAVVDAEAEVMAAIEQALERKREEIVTNTQALYKEKNQPPSACRRYTVRSYKESACSS